MSATPLPPETVETKAADEPANAKPSPTPAAELPFPQRRSVRSFVLRQGRVTQAQQRALDQLASQWRLPYAPGLLDLDTTFGRKAARVLEIGFGMGESTAEIAAAHPHIDYLAVEVHTPGVGSLLARIGELQLQNVRIIQHDAIEILEKMIAPEALDGVNVFFPDPWPKTRHHKRRLIQPPLVALLASRMAPGAILHCATDWLEYAEQMLAVLRAEPTLENTVTDYAPRPEARPQTKFESRGLRLGHGVRDLLFRKRSG